MGKIISNSSKAIKAYLSIISAALLSVSVTSCNKLLDATPKYILTPEKIFSNNDSANYAVAGLYGSMGDDVANAGAQAFTRDMALASSLSADEAYPASGFADATNVYAQLYQYALLPGSQFTVTNNYWSGLYGFIYQANSIIEGIQNSNGLTEPYRSQYLGEALFWRAYYYYLLVNFYGDVPLVISTDYTTTSQIARTPVADVYNQIIGDLKTADSVTAPDINANEVFRVNRTAIRALLARISLFTSQWADAEKYASEVIAAGKYSLAPIDKVFYDGSPETILGLETIYGYSQIATQTLPSGDGIYAVTDTGKNNLVSAYADNDLRKINYISYQLDQTDSIYISWKYRVNGSTQASDGHTESTVILRLAEQYLIRAEAEARQGKLADAIADVNIIRRRANATPVASSTNSSDVINAVLNERRLELSFEWDDRWFTLKRTNTADAVMSAVKPAYWKSYAQLYPIPAKELQSNHTLTQNSGY